MASSPVSSHRMGRSCISSWLSGRCLQPTRFGLWQSTSGNQCRSDYVCLPLQWQNDVMSFSMETELPLELVSKEDHIAVHTTVSVGSSSASESVVSRRVPFHGGSELRSEQCRERVTFMLEQTPWLPAEYGIERQARLLEKWFRWVLASAAPRCSSKRRHKWLSQGTCNAICAGAQVHKLMFAPRTRSSSVGFNARLRKTSVPV